jgi:hypothetical protein
MGVFSKLLGGADPTHFKAGPDPVEELADQQFTDVEARKPTVTADARTLLLSQIDKEWEQLQRSVQSVQLVMQSLGEAVKSLEKRLDKLEGKK